MWCARGMIPGYAVPILLREAERQGLHVTSSDLTASRECAA